MIEALADPQSAMTARVAELAKAVGVVAAPGALRASSTQPEAAKIKAKPMRSATVGRSPRISIEPTTPITGLPSTPSDAVAAGSRRMIANHSP